MLNTADTAGESDLPNRYNRMSPQDLSRALDDLHLTAGQFARLVGSQRKRVLQWLEPDDSKGEDIPHHIAVMCELLKLPDAMTVARQVTDSAIIESDE